MVVGIGGRGVGHPGGAGKFFLGREWFLGPPGGVKMFGLQGGERGEKIF